MLQNLTTEGRNPASENIDTLSALEIVRLMNTEDSRVADAVRREADAIARAMEAIADKLRQGGRLIYLGAGTSGRLGVLDATECPPTFNSPPGQVIGLIAGGRTALTQAVEGAEDHPEYAMADLEAAGVSSRDAVVGIATSGRTPYVIGGLQYAREKGAFTVGFSCNASPELAAAAELNISPVVGPEVISGSTRLKAGTATKMVLNMLTTGAMVLLGKTYGNLMVDLRATNKKLLDRTRRIVMMLTGLDAAATEELLNRCDGELKTAVVVQKRSIAPGEARELLADAGGHLRRALEAPPPDAPTTTNATVSSNPGLPLSPDLVSSRVALGIDGGGSKTVAWLSRCDDAGRWTIVGRGAGGPSNPQAVGFAAAFQNLDRAVDGAFADARIQSAEVAAACGALAGAEREADRRQVEQWAKGRKLARTLQLVHDALPLLAAGTPQGWGIALIAGTGSFAFGLNEQGQSARAGGWGYLLGDEGSGYIIALAALKAAAQAADGRAPATRLLERFMQKFNIPRPLDLIGVVYQGKVDRPTIAAWSDLVFEEADAGDDVAQQIVAHAARELAQTVAAVGRQIGLKGRDFPLAASGGLLIHHAAYRRQLADELLVAGYRADPIGIVAEPVAGAVVLAQRLIAAERSGS
jgi:N-acetylmuramic acid 6-phosphate etherase